MRALFFMAVFGLFVPHQVFGKLRVVSTIQDFAYFASKIGGDELEVSSILKGYQDPHFANAKPSYMVALARADLVLAVGLDLEIGWLPLVLQGARNPKIMPGEKGYLDCSQFITPIEVPPAGADRSKGDLHPKGNPHYWLDPVRAIEVAKGIAQRMKELSPAESQRFDKGLENLINEITEAKNEVERLLSDKTQTIVTYHVTFSYFFERFGLHPFGFIEPKPGIPPSPSHVAFLVEKLKMSKSPVVILVEPYYDRNTPRDIADKTNARVAVVSSSVGGIDEAVDYRSLLLSIANAIIGR